MTKATNIYVFDDEANSSYQGDIIETEGKDGVHIHHFFCSKTKLPRTFKKIQKKRRTRRPKSKAFRKLRRKHDRFVQEDLAYYQTLKEYWV